MGDWEDDDWEASADNFKPAAAPAAASTSQAHGTLGQAVLAKVAEPDMSKFQDEDQEEPVKEEPVAKPQPKKKELKKWQLEEKQIEDVPLDDPVEEKLRRQRLVEQADFVAAKELFGDVGGGLDIDRFLPKSVKDFEDFAATVASKYILGHKDSKNYKAFVKALVKHACTPMSAADSKDVEACVGLVRVEKTKAEAAAKVKTAPKKSLNMGGKGGLSAGLDDFQYADAGDGDDDFM